MKKLILLTVVSIFNTYYSQAQVKYEISTESSSIKWTGAKVTGEHYGFINLKDAFFLFDKEKLVGGEFNIDMNSIKCTDIENPKYANKLVEHLKDPDFFNSLEYPVSNFKITEVLFDGTSYMISGDLTIKDITQVISFPAKFVNETESFYADATLTIDRTKFDIKYGSGSFFDDLGNRMIYDDFNLNIHIEATK